MNTTNTICALSTALGESAINIIRISGEESIPIVSSIISGLDLTKKRGGTISLATIVSDGEEIDQVLISLFRAPKSYTKEDLVEINTHGGAYVTERVMELLLKKGCRMAEPGEFTKRAFLNGRIDLTEAEAVMDMIEAETSTSLKLANRGLKGEIYTLVTSLRKEIEALLLHIEVNIDYPEYTDETQVTRTMCISKTKELIDKISKILASADNMRIYREGIKTIIIGKPNVGKSSLLNAMIGENKAIVTSYQGTTRDIIEGNINLGGIVLHLLDTAGIRKTNNPIEKIGINKTLEVLDKAELVILVLDHESGITKEDEDLLKKTQNKKRIIIANKADLNKNKLGDIPYLDVSCLTKEGIPLLEDTIKKCFIKNGYDSSTDTSVSSSRHIALLQEAKSDLENACNSAISGAFPDMIAIDLNNAYNCLGLITGESESTTLVDELFKKFCLGK